MHNKTTSILCIRKSTTSIYTIVIICVRLRQYYTVEFFHLSHLRYQRMKLFCGNECQKGRRGSPQEEEVRREWPLQKVKKEEEVTDISTRLTK